MTDDGERLADDREGLYLQATSDTGVPVCRTLSLDDLAGRYRVCLALERIRHQVLTLIAHDTHPSPPHASLQTGRDARVLRYGLCSP